MPRKPRSGSLGLSPRVASSSELLAVAEHHDLDLVAGVGRDDRADVVEGGDGLPADAQHLVAGAQAGLVGAGALDHVADGPRRLVDRRAAEPLGERTAAGHAEDREGDDEEDEGLQEVHDRAGRHDQEAPRVRLLPVGAVLVLRRHVGLEVAHPEDAHVGAERDALDAVLGLAPLERPDLGPEEEEELGDLHARPLGREVVAELVQEDHDHEGADHDEPADAGEQPEGHDAEEEQRRGASRSRRCRPRAGWGRGAARRSWWVSVTR